MRYLLIILLLLKICVEQNAFAASSADDKAFNAALKLLDTKFYSLAETNFAKFVEQYPDSPHKAEAILHQAQARFYETNYVGALELLQNGISQTGTLADEYQFWIGESFFQNGKFREAADAFSALTKKFPQSLRLLEACYQEALAESKLGNWPRVIELLQSPESKFVVASKSQPNSPFFISGDLLLGDALLQQDRFDEAEKAVVQLNGKQLTPETRWRQNYLLCRIQLAAAKPENALETSTNLLLAAQEAGGRRISAESILMRGAILEKLKRLPEAIQAYEQNLTDGSVTNIPPEIRRESFFKTVELNLAQGDVTNAIGRLETFIAQNPSDAALDLAKLTLGELRLKQYVVATATTKPAASVTNFFEQALTNFNVVITNFPSSQHLGKAHLDRGWCFWLRDNFASAEADFSEATKRLPISEDRAVARFKLADTQLKQGNYAGAVTNYQILIRNHAAIGRVKNSLFEPALFQIVHASLEIGNVVAAKDAMQKLLDWFPGGSLSEESLLLVGHTFTRDGDPIEARRLFSDFLKRVPDSDRAPEIKLAIAQTHVQEKNWKAALSEYDGWVTNYATSPLLPQGEFSRALAHDKAGQESNAFVLFTNFVARFPTNDLAALAQNWIADFYWNHDDFRNAEKGYQELYQKFNPAPELGYQARLMAGRAAYDRLDYTEAAKYFSALITSLDKETNSAATRVTAEAWFALGDTMFQNFLANTNRTAEDFREIITALTHITKDYETNAIAARAWGQMGNYYFQWAGLNSAEAETQYKRAFECYGQVMVMKVADVSARSQADVGVGHVCVKKASEVSGKARQDWLNAALQHYMNVVTQNNLRDGETFDPKWVYEAGIAAAKICEGSGQWEQAREVYVRLVKLLPSLQPALEKKIAAAQTNLESAKN